MRQFVVASTAPRRDSVRRLQRLKLGPAWGDQNLVFGIEAGRPIEAGALLGRSFRPLLARTGCPRVRFHDLRRTAATLLVERGVPVKMVSEMLGHAGVSITLDLYAHVKPNDAATGCGGDGGRTQGLSRCSPCERAPMELPNAPEDWTYATLLEVVRRHEFEPDRFDYKAVLHATEQKDRLSHNLSISKAACSFANTSGGYIIFGVRDRKQSVGQPDDRLVGMAMEGDLRKEFGEKLKDLDPTVPGFDTSPQPILKPADAGTGFFVVYIPQSQARPHMVTSTGAFYRRSAGGNAEIMSAAEVREQMVNREERLRKANLLLLELMECRDIARTLYGLGGLIGEATLRFDTGAFNLLLADVSSMLPTTGVLLHEILQVRRDAAVANQLLDILTYVRTRDVDENTPRGESLKQRIKQNTWGLWQNCERTEADLREALRPYGV